MFVKAVTSPLAMLAMCRVGRRSPPWRERRPRCLPRGRAHPQYHGVASLGSSPRSRLQTLVAWERQWVSLLCAHALYAQLALSM